MNGISVQQSISQLLGLSTGYLVLCAVIIIFLIIIFWLVFRKAGQPGWAAMIPIYNLCIGLRIAGKPWWWIFGILFVFIPIFGLLLFLIEHIFVSYSISKNFGQATGFTIGLTLLPVIFYPIIAFGKYQWSAGHLFP
jgi:hypothetical protein